jgi:hypothetical protein
MKSIGEWRTVPNAFDKSVITKIISALPPVIDWIFSVACRKRARCSMQPLADGRKPFCVDDKKLLTCICFKVFWDKKHVNILEMHGVSEMGRKDLTILGSPFL